MAFTQTLQGDDARTFVAERDGVLVGALGAAISSGLCEFGMMVRDGHRGSGVGSLLVASCLAWCRTATCTRWR